MTASASGLKKFPNPVGEMTLPLEATKILTSSGPMGSPAGKSGETTPEILPEILPKVLPKILPKNAMKPKATSNNDMVRPAISPRSAQWRATTTGVKSWLPPQCYWGWGHNALVGQCKIRWILYTSTWSSNP